MAELVDLNEQGATLANGEPIEQNGTKAISTALKNYLNSNTGDFLVNPGIGGPLRVLKFKLLSRDTEAEKNKIETDISNFFKNELTIKRLTITPNFEKHRWDIELWFTDNTGATTKISTDIPSQNPGQPTEGDASDKVLQFTYEDIEFEGDNLYNFIEHEKEKIPGEKLVYNIDLEKWIWGHFLFLNFSVDSDNFTQILQMINGGS